MNIGLNPCNFLHTSSHPDKYNNSANNLFPKERREKIQGEILQRPHSSSNPRVFPVFLHTIQQVTTTSLILHTELILPQEIPKKYNNYKAHPVQASSSSCSPCIQAFYTAETKFQAPSSNSRPYSSSRLPVILPGRNSILHGSQPSRSPSSDSQAQST